MLKISQMQLKDEETVLPMVMEFYHSDAVDHAVETAVLKRTFSDAAGSCPYLEGFLLEDEAGAAGFAYLTSFYACEVGGITVMIEELYFKKESRGKGYGKKFFAWLFKRYPDARRFRLEVTRENEAACALYQKLGFEYLSYHQMVLDRSFPAKNLSD